MYTDKDSNLISESIQKLQLLYPAEHMLTNLPDITSFGHTTKYINHPSLIPDVSTTIKARMHMHDLINTCNAHQSNIAD